MSARILVLEKEKEAAEANEQKKDQAYHEGVKALNSEIAGMKISQSESNQKIITLQQELMVSYKELNNLKDRYESHSHITKCAGGQYGSSGPHK
ncbi:MAG: hypothetical protein H0W50_10600 [Parachlamydiaceae bacterium]|nr:hypothetical protein [Parachlamydiaceae bacterium]